jgi:hypothetical protein
MSPPRAGWLEHDCRLDGLSAVAPRTVRLAARLFVVLTLALLTATYLHWGLQAQTRVQLTQLVPVLVAGLILSRPALWWSTGWLAVAVLLGSWQDVEAARYEPSKSNSPRSTRSAP